MTEEQADTIAGVLNNLDTIGGTLSGFQDEPPQSLEEIRELADELYNLSAELQQAQTELEDVATEMEDEDEDD
jgi:uncharacterized protein YukE